MNIEVFVYPNPVRIDTANIRILNTKEPAIVSIYNISGQLVLQENLPSSVNYFRDFRFDTTRFSSGMYFAIVDINGRRYRDNFAIVR